MFISIVIPIWNDEKLLNECLDSCLDQGLSKDDYEIICVDDGSTDRTPQILQGYAERYPNIHVIEKEHTGRGGRSIGFRQVKGDYVWFVDHDDFIAPNALDDLKKVVAEHRDCDRIQFPCYRFNDALTTDEKILMREGNLQLNFSFPPLDWYVWSCIIKTAFMLEHGITPKSPRLQEAGAFWGIEDFRVWGGDWVLIDTLKDYGARTYALSGRALYYYRVHENSVTKRSDPEAVANREAKRYNMVLYRAHRAWVQKQQYLTERSEHGHASAETTELLIDKLRDVVSFLFMQPFDQRRDGVKQLLRKDIFLDKTPEEYQGSFRAYWKQLNKKERLLPHIWVFYYSYTKIGLRMYAGFSRCYCRFLKILNKK